MVNLDHSLILRCRLGRIGQANEQLPSLAGEGSCVVLPRDCGEMCRPRGGTFSYALRPLRGEGGHLDLRLDLVVDLLPHHGQGWTCGLVLVIFWVV